MRLIYNILFLIFFCLSAPYYFVRMRRRGNWQEGFSERFGKFSSKVKQAMTNRHVLWIHAVSVGEVNIATQLIAALETLSGYESRGYHLHFSPTKHAGSNFVELSMLTGDGKVRR